MLEEALTAIASSLHLREDDAAMLERSARLERYGVGEVVLPSDVVPDEVRVIVSGRAALALEADGGRIDVGTSGPGELIGQTALTRERTKVVTVVSEILTVVVLPLATVDELVRTRPRLAAEIGESLELKRRQAEARLAELGLSRSVTSRR